MTPIERAARALAKRRHQPQYDAGNSTYSPDYYANLYWRDYVEEARVVIEAAQNVRPAPAVTPAHD